jgi:hypothetical protein
MINLTARTIILGFLLLTPRSSDAQFRKISQTAVSLEIARPVGEGSLLNWKISNKLDVAVYVYDFYLWGPAYHIEQAADRVVIETAPIAERPGCPPNRFPPVLLLVIGPHRTIEGAFADPELNLKGKTTSLRISVGDDPYSVVEAAKRFSKSKCKHSPYDAIVRWGTVIESNAIRVQ